MKKHNVSDIIKERRESLGMTQLELAQKLNVSEKTISKWECNRGMPDIAILSALARELKISLKELFNGKVITNANKSFDMEKLIFYICPICRNVITSTGEISLSCCGVDLIKEEAVLSNGNVKITTDEIIFSANSPMTKDDYISFVCYVTSDKIDFVKLYPEGSNSVIFLKKGHGKIFYYDIKNGLYVEKV